MRLCEKYWPRQGVIKKYVHSTREGKINRKGSGIVDLSIELRIPFA